MGGVVGFGGRAERAGRRFASGGMSQDSGDLRRHNRACLVVSSGALPTRLYSIEVATNEESSNIAHSTFLPLTRLRRYVLASVCLGRLRDHNTSPHSKRACNLSHIRSLLACCTQASTAMMARIIYTSLLFPPPMNPD